MTYDAANDRFGYDLTGVSTGDYYYYYVVDGTGELDAFNSEKADYSGKECSVMPFQKSQYERSGFFITVCNGLQ